jgi:GH24 family phage-related lysozyme (muramidase)
MKLKANEEQAETGASSAPTLRYRQAKESFAKGKRIPEEELMEEVTVDGLVSPVGSLGDEMMSAEQWLNQINDLWLSGDHQGAKESLNQFLVAYPDYPIEKIKIILDPESGLMDNIR